MEIMSSKSPPPTRKSISQAARDEESSDEEEECSDVEPDGVKSAVKGLINWKESFRANVSKLLGTMSVDDVHRHYRGKIPIRTLYFWKRWPSRRKKSGRKPQCPELDDHLFEWFLLCRARQLPISNQDLKDKAIKIVKKYHERALMANDQDMVRRYANFGCSNGYIHKFKNRLKISRRRVSSLAKKPYSEQKVKLENFFKDFDHEISDNIALLVNFDETAVFFEFEVTHTLTLANNKTVSVYSSGKNKQRMTAIGAVASNGFKFPLIIILKTQSVDNNNEEIDFATARLSKNLQNYVRSTQSLILQNHKAWNNAYLMKTFIMPHIYKYLPKRRKALFVMDNCSAHSCTDMLGWYKANKVNYLFFPPDMTGLIQPFDVSLAKSFKAKIREKFRAHAMAHLIDYESKDGSKRTSFVNPGREEIVQWAIESWESIDADMIIKCNLMIEIKSNPFV
jgi:hypothetical protein